MVVVHLGGLLARMRSEDAAGVLDETAFERNRPCQEQGVGCGTVESSDFRTPRRRCCGLTESELLDTSKSELCRGTSAAATVRLAAGLMMRPDGPGRRVETRVDEGQHDNFGSRRFPQRAADSWVGGAGAEIAEGLQLPREDPPLVHGRCSARAVDGDCEGGTDLAHANLGHPAQPLDEDGDRDAFDRVEIHRRAKRDRVVTWFEHHLAGKPPDGRRAGSHECAAMPWDDHVAGQDNYRSATDLGHLTPPDFPPSREGSHDAAAALRNDARSPHSSGSSSGCSS